MRYYIMRQALKSRAKAMAGEGPSRSLITVLTGLPAKIGSSLFHETQRGPLRGESAGLAGERTG